MFERKVTNTAMFSWSKLKAGKSVEQCPESSFNLFCLLLWLQMAIQLHHSFQKPHMLCEHSQGWQDDVHRQDVHQVRADHIHIHRGVYCHTHGTEHHHYTLKDLYHNTEDQQRVPHLPGHRTWQQGESDTSY